MPIPVTPVLLNIPVPLMELIEAKMSEDIKKSPTIRVTRTSVILRVLTDALKNEAPVKPVTPKKKTIY